MFGRVRQCRCRSRIECGNDNGNGQETSATKRQVGEVRHCIVRNLQKQAHADHRQSKRSMLVKLFFE